jgi:uncharacterized membrane protein
MSQGIAARVACKVVAFVGGDTIGSRSGHIALASLNTEQRVVWSGVMPQPQRSVQGGGGWRLPLRFDHGIAAVEWPPLVDGTYAIVMTLMVIELPDVAINLLKDLNEDKASSVVIIAQLINLLLGYLTVFLVAYDVWVKKRRLLAAAKGVRLVSQTFVSVISLFLVTLLPPFYFIRNQLHQQESVLHDLIPGPEGLEIKIVETLLISAAILLYLLIAFGAQRVHRHLLRLKRLEEPAEQQAESLQTRLIALASLQRDALFRIVLIPLIVLPCTAIGLPAPLPVLAYSLTIFMRWHPGKGAAPLEAGASSMGFRR